MNNFGYALKKLVDWVFRRRSIGLRIMRVGFFLMCASLAGGWVIKGDYRDEHSSFSVDFNSAGGGVVALTVIAFFAGLILLVYGAFREWKEHKHEVARLAKKIVLVIEQRGLRDTTDTPLVDAVPDSFEGRRDQLLNDIRERIKDGTVTAPEEALEKVVHIKRDAINRIGRTDIQDVEIVYGGLFPVPFTFLTGMLFDDESRMTVFDWDRFKEEWRLLDGDDDGDRLFVEREIDQMNEEIVIAISVSYKVDMENIVKAFSGKPVLHLSLNEINSNGHWSKHKQDELANQFFEAVKDAMGKGAKKIHLIVAAPNSLVFKFGKSYDRRNLPEAVVYQYERSQNPAYPWGVVLPTHGIKSPSILFNT